MRKRRKEREVLIECDHCRSFYHLNSSRCPVCYKPNPQRLPKQNLFPFASLIWWKQLAAFLMGWLGINLINIVLILIFRSYARNKFVDPNLISEFLNSSSTYVLLNFLTYFILFIGLLFLIVKDILKILVSFKEVRAIGKGVAYGLLLIAATIFYNLIINNIGLEVSDNVNEMAVTTLMANHPLLSFLAFVLIGPIVEEITYRVGLFSLLSRYRKWAAYLGTALLFGLIHMTISSSMSKAEIINELLNLPGYIIAGLILSYAYDREGIATSTYAHIFNNLTGFLLALLANYLT